VHFFIISPISFHAKNNLDHMNGINRKVDVIIMPLGSYECLIGMDWLEKKYECLIGMDWLEKHHVLLDF
jgi:hypothetical protein